MCSAARRCWDAAALAALVAFDVALLTLPVLRMLHYAMPFASSFALLTEAVRLLMKTHAFVRSNAPRALTDGSVPGFSQFLYFMFAPTLVYCDNYPRYAAGNDLFPLIVSVYRGGMAGPATP